MLSILILTISLPILKASNAMLKTVWYSLTFVKCQKIFSNFCHSIHFSKLKLVLNCQPRQFYGNFCLASRTAHLSSYMVHFQWCKIWMENCRHWKCYGHFSLMMKNGHKSNSLISFMVALNILKNKVTKLKTWFVVTSLLNQNIGCCNSVVLLKIMNKYNRLGLSCDKLRSSYASQPAHYPNF